MPGLNEEKYVGSVLQKVSAYTPNIIFIDDGSSDATFSEAKKSISHVLRHRVNMGKGAALKTGCDYAFDELGANTVIMMDSDDQHNPAELQSFVKAFASSEAEIVFGTRRLSGDMPGFKRFFNQLASHLVQVLFQSPFIPDIPSGYKALNKKAYKKLRWNALGYQVEMEIACRVSKYRIPFTTITIDTIYHDHDKGMTILNTLDFLHNILWWRITL